MKHFLTSLLAVALCVACQPANPIRDAMEQYAKEHIENPDTFKYEYMGIEKEYTYFNDLVQYRLGLQKLAEKAEDKSEYLAEDDRIQPLFEKYGTQVACREYSLYFHTLGGSSGKMQFPGVVLARYDADGKLMEMTLDPDSLPTYPALQMLRDRGEL